MVKLYYGEEEAGEKVGEEKVGDGNLGLGTNDRLVFT